MKNVYADNLAWCDNKSRIGGRGVAIRTRYLSDGDEPIKYRYIYNETIPNINVTFIISQLGNLFGKMGNTFMTFSKIFCPV